MKETCDILHHCHPSPYGGHFRLTRIATKVLKSSFSWPSIFQVSYAFVKTCDYCQRVGKVSKRRELSLNNLLEAESFDVQGIDFMCPFSSLFGHSYILLEVDYVSKQVNAIATITSDACAVMKLLQKHIFTIFDTSCAIISDEGLTFEICFSKAALDKYGIKHKVVLTLSSLNEWSSQDFRLKGKANP